ncbi:MAG: hypothetical protein ACRELX_10910 [Longimicrobiales bacterium]
MRILFLLVCLGLGGCDGARAPRTTESGEDAVLRALVDSLLPSLERVSGLVARAPVRVERRSSEQVRAFVEEQLREEMPPERLAGIHATYALLGLIPDTLDLRALLLDLYTEQIVGYYDPETKTLYAVEQVPREALRPVLTHELVHALQDQYANLDSLISPERGNDRQIAAQAAFEGHATLVMLGLLASEATGAPVDPATLPNPGEQLRLGLEDQNSEFPVFRRAPRTLREMLMFPYAAGAAFVQALWRADAPGDGRAVPLGTNLPQSTEQVLWPADAFLASRDAPTELRSAGGAAWPVVYENTLGAFETRLFLEQHLGAGAGNARGWDGDRFYLLENPGGGHALVWISIWDDVESADRFVTAVRHIIDAGSLAAAGTVSAATLEDRPIVRVVLVPSDRDPAAVPPLDVHCADTSGAEISCGGTAEKSEEE